MLFFGIGRRKIEKILTLVLFRTFFDFEFLWSPERRRSDRTFHRKFPLSHAMGECKGGLRFGRGGSNHGIRGKRKGIVSVKKSPVLIKPSFLVPLCFLFIGSPLQDTLIYFAAVLLHEVGHLLAIYSFGYRAEGLTLSLAGAAIRVNSEYVPYRKEILIFLAGPGGNGVGCLLALILLRMNFTREGMLFFFSNALLALFNLLPIRGLDGERALFSLLCLHTDQEKARLALSVISKVALMFLLTLSILVLKESQNPSLLFLTLALIWGEAEKRKKATNKS